MYSILPIRLALLFWLINCIVASGFDYSGSQRRCEPIQIDLCKDIGYNETSMPNLFGNELQSDVDLFLKTFVPLIEFECSPLLKNFLCASYVPMCAPKIPMHLIGPCQSLCEIVRTNCNPVLESLGFSWPAALKCSNFPLENNENTMCMEGPVGWENVKENGKGLQIYMNEKSNFECPGYPYPNIYVKLNRLRQCAFSCNADVLFGEKEKYLAECWVQTFTFAILGLVIFTIFCKAISKDSKSKQHSSVFTTSLWCHLMVVCGWTLRFIVGRTESSCGFDPEVPDVLILLKDGLYNVFCTIEFLLRYYFGMAALAWWSIICLGWHSDLRRLVSGKHVSSIAQRCSSNRNASMIYNRPMFCVRKITQSTSSKSFAWGLPAIQTAAIIILRLVDADELLGSCFVGNQSDRGLQIFVATPIFWYWIFGTVNLISGFLIYNHRDKSIKNVGTRLDHYLCFYCFIVLIMLVAAIYEYVNIDYWLSVPYNVSVSIGNTTPMWPFLGRAFVELMLCLICSSWILGPIIAMFFKRKFGMKACPQSKELRHLNCNTSNIEKRLVPYKPGRVIPVSHMGMEINRSQYQFITNNGSILYNEKRLQRPALYTLDII